MIFFRASQSICRSPTSGRNDGIFYAIPTWACAGPSSGVRVDRGIILVGVTLPLHYYSIVIIQPCRILNNIISVLPMYNDYTREIYNNIFF